VIKQYKAKGIYNITWTLNHTGDRIIPTITDKRWGRNMEKSALESASFEAFIQRHQVPTVWESEIIVI
jgi:hypothetical protein